MMRSSTEGGDEQVPSIAAITIATSARNSAPAGSERPAIIRGSLWRVGRLTRTFHTRLGSNGLLSPSRDNAGLHERDATDSAVIPGGFLTFIHILFRPS